MPAKSKAQFRLMKAIEHNPGLRADKGKKFKEGGLYDNI
jgi:hypothetical protein